MRIDEINTRLAAISAEAENEGADINALTAEADALIAERKAIQEAGEKRASLLSKIAAGEVGKRTEAVKEKTARKAMTREEALASEEYRNFFAKTLMRMPVNEDEQTAARAAGVALTTTATTFVEAGVAADGVNNGGLFIPTEMSLALVKEAELVSPIFRDVAKDNLPGVLKFPYKVSGTGADVRTEGTPNPDGQIEWAELELTTYEISETIRVTWKLERMAVPAFLSYLQTELIAAVKDAMIDQAIYGTGTGEVTGVTASAGSANEKTYDGTDPLAAIKEGLALLSGKQKAGAKIYISNSVAEEIMFHQDANSFYNFAVVNGTGISTIGGYPAEKDPYLHDGDIVIGNMKKFRLNEIEPISVSRDSSGKQRVSDYTAYGIVAGAGQPGEFVYISKE